MIVRASCKDEDGFGDVGMLRIYATLGTVSE